MVITKGKRLIFFITVVFLVGITTGFFLGSVLTSDPPTTKTFNIVTYHWGYALYDEDWNEIEQIEVEQGTIVRLIAVPAYSLSHEMQEEFHERVLETGVADYPAGDDRIPALMEAAHADHDTSNHGVFIAQLNVDLKPDGHATTLDGAIDSVEFTANTIGVFDISCSVNCGVGHSGMILEGVFVVS